MSSVSCGWGWSRVAAGRKAQPCCKSWLFLVVGQGCVLQAGDGL